jgi:hypothetical protein
MTGVHLIVHIDFFQPFVVQFEMLKAGYVLKLAIPVLGTAAAVKPMVAQ